VSSSARRPGEEDPQPDASELVTVGLTALRGREVAELDEARFADYLRGAKVLVTGAGGSLGRVLCRRVADLEAAEIVLVDQAEAALVDIHHELRYDLGFTGGALELADLRAPNRAHGIIAKHQPDVVFHTAGYKLVPIVEAHPVEAAENNVLATAVLVDAAKAEKVGRFVLYSTDKAIRPQTVLGRTKAVAECIVGTAARESTETRFACTRLGNVLESSGSMLPLFRRQVRSQRPVTVTDVRMTRYVMTHEEATGLAIVAGGLAARGDVFRLDMGRPVRVLDAARAVLTAAGHRSEGAIDVVGSRPGEKLHEDLEEPGEAVWPTAHGSILRSGPRYADPAWLDSRLRKLRSLVDEADAEAVRVALEHIAEGIRVDGRTGAARVDA